MQYPWWTSSPIHSRLAFRYTHRNRAGWNDQNHHRAQCGGGGGRGGATITVGAPLVSGATVTGTVLRQDKEKKILVFKYKPKKRVRKLTGHRQSFAEIKITKIQLP